MKLFKFLVLCLGVGSFLSISVAWFFSLLYYGFVFMFPLLVVLCFCAYGLWVFFKGNR